MKRRTIVHLLSEIRFKAENKELVDEIIRLSKEYGIITPYTSFFVAEAESRFNSVTNSAAKPGYGKIWSMDKYGTEALGVARALDGGSVAMRDHGKSAIMGAQHIGALKQSAKSVDTVSDAVKYSGEKTFYLRDDGYWVDSKFKEGMNVKDIKYLSPEYLEP